MLKEEGLWKNNLAECNKVEKIAPALTYCIKDFTILLSKFFMLLIKKGGGIWPHETLATISPEKGATSILLRQADKSDA